jgi:serine/threonine protein kinase
MLDLVRNKYKLVEEIGKGNFGVVCKAFDIVSKKEVAVKFDTTKIKLLRHEATIINYLTSNKCKNIPIIYWFGIYGDCLIPCIVMPLYKYSILQYISLQEIDEFVIFKKMLTILETIHSLFVIHRDIKPDNFMFDSNGELFLLDFGLSTFVEEDKSNEPHFTGNAIYASPNIHNLKAAKVIDDVISVSYVYLYMCYRGKLPWSHIDDTTIINSSKLEKIVIAKKIENIENDILDVKFIHFLNKLYCDILCYNL